MTSNFHFNAHLNLELRNSSRNNSKLSGLEIITCALLADTTNCVVLWTRQGVIGSKYRTIRILIITQMQFIKQKQGYQLTDETGGICSTHGGDEKYTYFHWNA